MATPERTACPLARDLFIPYLAGEVSPETKAWLERHLAECDECRAAMASVAGGATPRPAAAAELGRQLVPTTDEAWRQLLRRVRRRNLLITVALSLALVVTFASISWTLKQLNAWGGLPLYQPIPLSGTTPSQAVVVDLTPVGLTDGGVAATDDGAKATWFDTAGNAITIEASRFSSSDLAQATFLEWCRTESTSSLGLRLRQWEPTSRATAMYRDPRTHFYVWQTGEWFIIIRVPSRVTNAARLCTTIRDVLFATYGAGSPVPSGVPTPKPWR